jgi:hypothetical protein
VVRSLRGVQSEEASPLHPYLSRLGGGWRDQDHTISFCGYRARAKCCDMWLFRNNPLKKITDPFAALSVWGSYVRLPI